MRLLPVFFFMQIGLAVFPMKAILLPFERIFGIMVFVEMIWRGARVAESARLESV